MPLPIPRPDEVEAFRRLYTEIYGVELTDVEALEVTTQALQLYYVKTMRISTDSVAKDFAPEEAAAQIGAKTVDISIRRRVDGIFRRSL